MDTKFKKQVLKARAQSRNNAWSKNRRSYGIDYAVKSGNQSLFTSNFSDRYMGDGFSRAYSNKEGYAIKTNPRNGKKEMFVRGTAKGKEWVSNLVESPVVPGTTVSGIWSRYRRGQFTKKLSNIAKKAGVKTIYGHSRGAAIVGDMNVPGASKIGVDGATLLRGKKVDVNYRQKQLFDAGIGMRSKRTFVKPGWVPVWKYSRYHKVWK